MHDYGYLECYQDHECKGAATAVKADALKADGERAVRQRRPAALVQARLLAKDGQHAVEASQKRGN